MWTASLILDPPDELAPGETRHVHHRYGPFSIVATPAGLSGPIWHTVAGFRLWEADTKPRLTIPEPRP